MIRLTLKLLAVCILMSGLAAAAEPTLVERAQKGDAAAQLELGLKYFIGEGIPKDSTEAVKWWRKAAEQGYADAQCSLGLMYFIGEGVPKDSAEAAKWWRKSADQGLAPAQSNLGMLYDNGDGVLQDSAEAVKWYRKAAAQGDAGAQSSLDYIYAKYRKAAEQGDPNAQIYVGWMYLKGEGVPKDITTAAKWYRMAAEQGHANAQGSLGKLYADGEGVPKDAIEGLAWTNIAAATGSEIWIKNRSLIEARLGPQATLAAQQRSKQILKEIEAKKRAAASSTPEAANFGLTSTTVTPIASGSGAIVSPEGYVLTAAHVVANATSVKALTTQGVKAAKVVRIDEANDLAVLKLETGTYIALPVVPSRMIRLGQMVATIGFPNVQIQGFSPKVTRGEISSRNGIGDDPRAWQISVPVQPGNSGGPLLDENGNLVGVVVSKLGLEAAKAMGDLPQNVNYAVKSSYALALLEPYLGSDVLKPNQGKPNFEDMVATAQQSVVLILVY